MEKPQSEVDILVDHFDTIFITLEISRDAKEGFPTSECKMGRKRKAAKDAEVNVA
jgi:hypothetical protein